MGMYGLTCLLTGVLFAFTSEGKDPYKETTQIMNGLFNKSRYDSRVRPYIHEDKVNVSVSMTIVNFGQIKEKDMEFTVDMFFYQEWSDERLQHSSEYPINLAGADKKLVWMPDTFFLNIKTAKTHMVPADNTKLTIWPSGSIRYSTRLTLTAGCEMNLLDYPLDTQNCNLTILSYSYSEKEMSYIWAGATKKTISIMNDAMSEFTLIDIQLSREIYEYRSGPWVHLTCTFQFKRRIQYSLLQVYAPTFLIVALSWLSFWIPKEAAPARIALGITTVLTIVTLMGSLRAEFPKVSYVKAIDLFFIVSFMFVFGAVLEYIFLLLKCALDEKKAQERKNKLAYVRQLKDFKDTTNGINIDGSELEHGRDATEEMEEEEEGRPKQTEVRMRKFNSSKSFKSTRKVVRFMFVENDASVVDRVSRVLFPFGYMLFNLIYWLYYTQATFK